MDKSLNLVVRPSSPIPECGLGFAKRLYSPGSPPGAAVSIYTHLMPQNPQTGPGLPCFFPLPGPLLGFSPDPPTAASGLGDFENSRFAPLASSGFPLLAALALASSGDVFLGLKAASVWAATSSSVPLLVPSARRGLRDSRSWSSLYAARRGAGWYRRARERRGGAWGRSARAWARSGCAHVRRAIAGSKVWISGRQLLSFFFLQTLRDILCFSAMKQFMHKTELGERLLSRVNTTPCCEGQLLVWARRDVMTAMYHSQHLPAVGKPSQQPAELHSTPAGTNDDISILPSDLAIAKLGDILDLLHIWVVCKYRRGAAPKNQPL